LFSRFFLYEQKCSAVSIRGICTDAVNLESGALLFRIDDTLSVQQGLPDMPRALPSGELASGSETERVPP